MCGIAGAINLRGERIPDLERRLEVMNSLISHRGPDDSGTWVHEGGHVGLTHRRLSIIDLEHGHQPMSDEAGRWISYNGEIYNYPELMRDVPAKFRTSCDTEALLRAHGHWGAESLDRLRGMFAYAIWDETEGELFCARDRFGIKPFYYAVVGDVFHFASEAKALLPMLPSVETDLEGLKDYLAFQFCLAGKTLFDGIRELPPGHFLRLKRGGGVQPQRYWEVFYEIDWDHDAAHFTERIEQLLDESVDLHMRSDVPVSAYLSGGVDSSAVASLAARDQGGLLAFTGKFSEDSRYDESEYARIVAQERGLDLHEIDIGVGDFIENDREGRVPHGLSGGRARLVPPVHGLPESGRAREGDPRRPGRRRDLRRLHALPRRVLRAVHQGGDRRHARQRQVRRHLRVDHPQPRALRNYKPMLREFWKEGLFEELDRRYYRLINRAHHVENEVDVAALGDYSPFQTFQEIFNGPNVGHQAYFDKMTHFDFKTLLPALLQVEDRVSMAHGLESRVPLLDHRLIELAATIPADIKFQRR